MWQFFQNYRTNCITSEINEINNRENLRIYPNPFKNKISLINTTGFENYILLNAMGQVIWTGKNIEQKDFLYLPNGLYFLKVENRILKLIKE